MSDIIEVTPSGTVGKQVYATAGTQVILEQVILTAPTSAATVVIRDGNASGETKITMLASVGETMDSNVDEVRFDKGMHVKVTPTDALAYLVIN